MKRLLVFILIFNVSLLYSQDTIIVNNNFVFKLGVKFSNEGSADITKEGNHIYAVVFGGGAQFIAKINKSKSSIESGVFYTTKVQHFNYYYYFYDQDRVYNHYLMVPVNYRFDTKLIYFSAGVFFDYLLSSDNWGIDSSTYGTDRKFNMGYNFAIGIEKQFSNSMSFFVEGKVFNTLSSTKTDGGFLINDGHLKTSYQNYGISIGLNYKFLKK